MANPLADALMSTGPLAAPELKRSKVLEDAIAQLHASYKNGIGSDAALAMNLLSDGLLSWGKSKADKAAKENQAKDDAGLADFYGGVLSPQALTQASAPSGPIDISPPPVGQEAPPPQPMPQQAPQSAPGVDPQMVATLKTMLSHPDPRVRQQGQMMAQEALAKMYAPPETAVFNTPDGIYRAAKDGPEGMVYGVKPKPEYEHVGNTLLRMDNGQPTPIYTAPDTGGGGDRYEPATAEEKAAMGMPETAAVQIDRRTGKMQVLQKQRQYTDAASASAQFGDRLVGSGKTIDELENDPDVWNGVYGVGQIGMGGAEVQRARQAVREFTNAILRKESGAAIGSDEFDSAKRQYFPVPGDGPEVIAQKRAARQRATIGLINSSQGAYEEWYGKPAPSRGGVAEPPPPTPPQAKRLKYNPATGRLE